MISHETAKIFSSEMLGPRELALQILFQGATKPIRELTESFQELVWEAIFQFLRKLPQFLGALDLLNREGYIFHLKGNYYSI